MFKVGWCPKPERKIRAWELRGGPYGFARRQQSERYFSFWAGSSGHFFRSIGCFVLWTGCVWCYDRSRRQMREFPICLTICP
ncbi:hypothetical protein MLD38_003683 [Melastoma candidum]|uniref:Uncharacterized protein n=1 Tax=Melastoma candidum TaxID=119954 RepID=A0ACB9S4X2_9MYRT|nr:hypothetical protein MLD38_003683 [Melastoma candidum]